MMTRTPSVEYLRNICAGNSSSRWPSRFRGFASPITPFVARPVCYHVRTKCAGEYFQSVCACACVVCVVCSVMGFVYISGGMSEALCFFITVLSHVHCFLNTTTSRTTTHCYSHHKLIPKIHVYTCVRAHTRTRSLLLPAFCPTQGRRAQVPLRCCNTLCHATHCNTLQHTANCNTLKNRGSVLKFHLGARQGCAFLQLCSSRFVAVCCSVLQCVAVCCSAMQQQFCEDGVHPEPPENQCVIVCCSMLQYLAVCCSVL